MLEPTPCQTRIVVMLLCTLLRNGTLDRVIVFLESSLRVALAWDRLGTHRGQARNIGGERLPCTLKRHCLACCPHSSSARSYALRDWDSIDIEQRPRKPRHAYLTAWSLAPSAQVNTNTQSVDKFNTHPPGLIHDSDSIPCHIGYLLRLQRPSLLVIAPCPPSRVFASRPSSWGR